MVKMKYIYVGKGMVKTYRMILLHYAVTYIVFKYLYITLSGLETRYFSLLKTFGPNPNSGGPKM